MLRLYFSTIVVLFCLFARTPAYAELPPIEQFGDAFWTHWGDGQAELAGYELKVRRYGQVREGTAVAIFVTETFSDELQVKAGAGRHPASDTYPVMKLNLVEDFATGIYDYNLMTSAFIALSEVGTRPRGTITKLSHSMQEWCGQTWIQMNFRESDVDFVLHSYFDGEADQSRLIELPEGTVSEDTVLLWARGLAAPFLAPGESSERPLLRAARYLRMTHSEPGWIEARFVRASEVTTLEVPAGIFEAHENRIQHGDEVLWRIWVDSTPPHRILKWSAYPDREAGSEGSLTGSDRIKYWERNAPGGEAGLEKLGMAPAK